MKLCYYLTLWSVKLIVAVKGEIVMEQLQYVGKIPELRGKKALTQPMRDYGGNIVQLCPKKHLLAQFDDPIEVGGKRLHLGWHPFLRSDFMKITDKPVF